MKSQTKPIEAITTTVVDNHLVWNENDEDDDSNQSNDDRNSLDETKNTGEIKKFIYINY